MQQLACAAEMLFGMIPVHGLPTVVEVLLGQIPDPGRAVAQHNAVMRLAPVPAVRVTPHPLSKDLRSAQMRDVTILDRLRQFNLLAAGFVKCRTQFDFEGTTHLQLFPTLLQHVDLGPIHRHTQLERLARLAAHDLAAGRRGVGRLPLRLLHRLKLLAPLFCAPPNTGIRERDLPDALQHLGRFSKRAPATQPDGVLRQLLAPVLIPQPQLFIQGGKDLFDRSRNSNSPVPAASRRPGSRPHAL